MCDTSIVDLTRRCKPLVFAFYTCNIRLRSAHSTTVIYFLAYSYEHDNFCSPCKIAKYIYSGALTASTPTLILLQLQADAFLPPIQKTRSTEGEKPQWNGEKLNECKPLVGGVEVVELEDVLVEAVVVVVVEEEEVLDDDDDEDEGWPPTTRSRDTAHTHCQFCH